MPLPRYEVMVEHDDEPQEGHPASEAPHASLPPPYVQPAPPIYFSQESPSPYHFLPNIHKQQLVSVPSMIHTHINPMQYYETFLNGRPKALGIVIIIAAISQIILGIVHVFIKDQRLSFFSGIMFWGPVIHIIAGSLSIAAQRKPNIGLIRGSLGMNILSSITSAAGVVISGVDIYILQFQSCVVWNRFYYCVADSTGPIIIVSILLCTEVLILWFSFTTSVFGCRSVMQAPVVQQVLMMPNDLVLPTPPATQPVAFLQPPDYPSGHFTPEEPPK